MCIFYQNILIRLQVGAVDQSVDVIKSTMCRIKYLLCNILVYVHKKWRKKKKFIRMPEEIVNIMEGGRRVSKEVDLLPIEGER